MLHNVWKLATPGQLNMVYPFLLYPSRSAWGVVGELQPARTPFGHMKCSSSAVQTRLLVFRRASTASKVSSLDADRLPSPLCGEPVFPLSCSSTP